MGSTKVFEGLKVCDFCWIGAGPMTTKYLSDHGATVVRIESSLRPDGLRRGSPYRPGTEGLDRSGYYANYNSNKLSVAINMAKPQGKSLAKRIISWSDLVTENFTPGTLERWGMGYDELTKIKSNIILFSTSMFARGGPFASQPGFGGFLTPMTGFTHLTGWPDREPVNPYGAYSDFFAGRFGISAIIAALNYRHRTGKGQHIDMSQGEAASHFLAPVILDYTLNGTEMSRIGNRSTYAAPHSAYPCYGEDRWIAIAVTTDKEWQSLCQIMGNPDWCKEERFSTLLGRKSNEEDLDNLVGQWTQDKDSTTLMWQLQIAGVPAMPVQDCRDLFQDPQLKARDQFAYMNHPVIGMHTYQTTEFKLSETPYQMERHSPLLGQDTILVLQEFLGLSQQEIIDLKENEILQ